MMNCLSYERMRCFFLRVLRVPKFSTVLHWKSHLSGVQIQTISLIMSTPLGYSILVKFFPFRVKPPQTFLHRLRQLFRTELINMTNPPTYT